MNDTAIFIENLGKMYKLYRNPADKVLDTFGINHWLFWRKNYYQEFWALRGLNLEVKKGERLGIIGRNGAGKSTLLKIITGNVSPTEGMVEVKGRIQALMELGTGFHPEFTGRENIRASLAYQGLSKNDIDGKEEEIIDFSELEDFIDQPIKTYSAGMYARLAFSTATSIQPEILIIDEVLGAGDAYFAGKCLERMKKLTEESGSTVLFVSHDLGSVQALCDRIIWIQKGVIAGDGQPLKIIKQYSALVRKEEDIRLKARDLKISKKQAVLIETQQDIYQKFLFRIVSLDGGHPSGIHKIRTLSLCSSNEKIGIIEVGSPLDNHPDQEHFIMTDANFMDWGKIGKDQYGYYRLYGNFKGKYAHAPFQFSVPKSYLFDSDFLSLEVTADCRDESIAIELFIPEKSSYHRLGIIDKEHKQNQFSFQTNIFIEDNQQNLLTVDQSKLLNLNNFESKEIDSTTDEYGSKQELVITKIDLLDAQGKSTKMLNCLQPFQIVLEYMAKVTISNPTFVFCIYLPSGLTVSQWLISTDELGQENLSDKGQIIFEGESLILGKGSYVASAAIFKWYPSHNIEPEAYHVLDRCIHFQVIDSEETDPIDHGICRQPIKTKIKSTFKDIKLEILGHV